MKRILVLIAFIFSTAVWSSVYAQGNTPPPATGDVDLRDTDVKRRSVELERVERDAKKGDRNTSPEAKKAAEDRLAAKFAEIKTDYEQMQLSQDAVVRAYQTGGKIDYAQISKSAQEVNKSAARLNSNLFPAETGGKKKEEKKKDKSGKESQPAQSVRDLIVDLDNAIGSFTKSPMFRNLRVVDAEVSKKAKSELEKIIELSALLTDEARKMETSGGEK